MPEAPKQLKVFLCHSSHDKPVVNDVYKLLNAEGWIDPWLDQKKLLPGMDWNMEIEKAVEASHIVLVFLTNNSVNKEGYIQRELRRVLDVALNMTEDTIFVIPLKLEECDLPRSLRIWQWLNYFPSEERVDAYERLLTSLKIRANKLGIATDSVRIPPKAEPASTPSKVLPPVVEMHSASPDSDLDLYIPPEYAGATFTPPPAKVKTWTFGGIEFVKVPHGEFFMGSKDKNELATDDEKPQHVVNIPYDFLMARFPITNEQFMFFVDSSLYSTVAEKEGYGMTWVDEDWKRTKGADWKHPRGPKTSIGDLSKHPALQLTWTDGLAYCEWLMKQFGNDVPKGLIFRPPTEAEWEKAARGTDGREWPWGNQFDEKKCNSSEGGRGVTTPIGIYSPFGDSPYGVCDSAGNIWEWTTSLWGKDDYILKFVYPYDSRDGRERLNIIENFISVVRGGCYDRMSDEVRCAFRGYRDRKSSHDDTGFRIVLAPRLA